MLSKTRIKLRSRRKTSPDISGTIAVALKNEPWQKVAQILSGPTRFQAKVNLDQIEEKTKIGDTIVIFGKVLSLGKLKKKVRIVALSISESAKEKLKETKSEYLTIAEEIKKNPKAEGVKILE